MDGERYYPGLFPPASALDYRSDPATPGDLFRRLAATNERRSQVQHGDYQRILADVKAAIAIFQERLEYHELEAGAVVGVGDGSAIAAYLGDMLGWQALLHEINALDADNVKRRDAWDQYARHRLGGVS